MADCMPFGWYAISLKWRSWASLEDIPNKHIGHLRALALKIIHPIFCLCSKKTSKEGGGVAYTFEFLCLRGRPNVTP